MAALWPTPGLARGESAFRPAPPTGIIIADWQVCAGLNWDVCKESSAIMADEYQLAMLRDGVRPWNLWRKANPEIAIDLSKADRGAAPACGVQRRALALYPLRGVREPARGSR